ncbi:MAG: flagellar export protein FliJ [Anaerovoracaceae bacterium]
MKKFEFSLGAVQRYKDQSLDLVKLEYAAAVGAVAEQKQIVAELKESFQQKNQELKEKSAAGTNIIDLINVKQYLLGLQERIDSAVIRQAKLENEAERVKERMVQAKTESASIDILKEKQISEYRAAARKSEDAFIEEFISSKMYRSS